ncbi:MAG: TonB-dependent receptor [Vicinamibacterales bacterium]|jgi:outer membrane receptor protein involved in Fe transport
MFTRALVLLAILAFPTSAFALKGRVVDQQGQPVANATVSILGRPGEAITDADGRFEWQPDPPTPFEVLIIDKAGNYARPVMIERLEAGQELTVTIQPLLSESVTVSGSAPSIEATPGAATTSISGRDVTARQPTNLMQAIENVAGVNQVSEGQAAVPAIRGLARGRTLILIDGARVSSERRVGAGATFLDPSLIEGVDVARGPGSVAYGSDAFGGVISVRTRRVAPGSPWAAQFSGTLGAGVPERRGSVEISKGLAEGGLLIAAHSRQADDWHGPAATVFNSGFADHGVMVRAEHKAGAGVFSAGWQSDFGRDIERPRNNSRTVRFFYPTEDSHRFTTGYEAREAAGFQRLGVTGFMGSYAQVTDQDRFATATNGRVIERAEVSAKDFQVRGFGERLIGKSRLEVGLDVNGRVGLHAVDDLITHDLAGTVVSTRPNVSVDSAGRTDTGAYVSIDSAVAARLVLGAGARADYVTTRNEGGYFGDRSTGNGAFSGFASATLGSFKGFSLTGQIARGFRDPVLSDRYYRGPTGRGFITGNPDLDPETSIQGDVALRYLAPRFRVAAFYYEYRIHDLIERYSTATDFFFFRNRGTARIRGFEIEGQADLGAGVTLELATQVAEGRALDDHAYLDDISPVNLSAVLRKQFGERGFGQVRAAYFSDDDHFGPTERAVPGYTLIDAAGGVKVAKPLELRIQARNLLNQEYYASQDVRTVFAPGRSASLVATVKF